MGDTKNFLKNVDNFEVDQYTNITKGSGTGNRMFFEINIICLVRVHITKLIVMTYLVSLNSS